MREAEANVGGLETWPLTGERMGREWEAISKPVEEYELPGVLGTPGLVDRLGGFGQQLARMAAGGPEGLARALRTEEGRERLKELGPGAAALLQMGSA
jgi:hypothetical protein